MTLVVHDSELRPVAILDNEKQGTLNYNNDQLRRQLTTGSSVFEVTISKKTLEGDTPMQHKYDVINDQSFISFIRKGKLQVLNIMRIEEDEDKLICYCENLNLELLNEFCPPFNASKAMSFEEYLIEFDMINFAGITIGVNEVKDKKLTLEWTATESKLSRLLSIASNFDAEIEFETKLNNNYTFKQLVLNVYKEYEEGKSLGIGQDKTDTILRYHKDITGIKRTVDKRELYNAVMPYGKKKVSGTRVVSNPVTKKVTKLIGSRKTYVGGDLKLPNYSFSKANVQAIIDYAVQYNILPSGLIVQLFVESFWGNSNVAKADNNWGGITWTGATTRPSGVTVSRGGARPPGEGGYYNHYTSSADYLKDYTYLLAKQGLYNVVGKKTFNDYVKGLFIDGGAKYNYAEIGYEHYISSMTSVRNQINKYNGNILNTIDTIWKTPVTPITETTIAKRATQTINVLNQISGMKGHRVGSGQCYALSAWYAMKLNGPGLGGGVTGIRGLTGGGMAAALIGHDYNWGSYGWKVDKAPTASNLQSGGIYNIRANSGSPVYTGVYGHTGIIKSVTATQVTVYEQNWGGRMYIVENVYNKSALVAAMSSVCYPREIAQGLSVTGATTQQVSGGTQISYDEIVQEAQTETYEEEQIVYIDKSIYKEWKDENGKVEFYLKNGMFYAPQSRDRYPSVLSGNETGDNWIRKDMEVDTDDPNMLETVGLKDIKAHAYPNITYEVEGYIDADIGDVVRIQDDGFNPPLLLTARVIEQVTSETNKSLNKTTFSNFVEKKSQISDSLIDEMLRMYDDATPYNIRLATSNGVAFKNGLGESLLTPTLEKNGTEYDAIFMYKNEDIVIDMGPQLLVKAADFSHVLNVTVEAYINDKLVATAQVSFTDTEDGSDGVGVNSVSITYGLSKSASTQPTTWTTDLPVAGQGDYLWTRKITDYTDSTKEDTIELTYSFQGKDGVAGASLKVSKIEYKSGTSGTVAPTGTWSTGLPVVPDGQFLWMRVTMSDNSTIIVPTKQGQTGPKGDPGKDGNGINGVITNYGVSNSNSTQPTSWSTSLPIANDGQYLWTRTVIDYTDPNVPDTVQLSYTKQGQQGVSGTSVTVSKIEYQAGSSGVNPPSGTWSTSIVSVPSGQYLWTKMTFSDSTVSYGISKQGADGKIPFFAYANSADGKTDFSTTDSTNKQYIGTYTGYTQSTNYLDYKWVNMIGSIALGNRNFLASKYLANNVSSQDFTLKAWAQELVSSANLPNILQSGQTYTVSFDAEIVGKSTVATIYSLQVGFAIHSPSNAHPFTTLFLQPSKNNAIQVLNEKGRFELTFVCPNLATDSRLLVYSNRYAEGTNFDLDTVKFTNVNFMIGNIASKSWVRPIEDVDDVLDTKADDALTTEQLLALAEEQRLMKADTEAKASIEELNYWVQVIKDEIKAREDGQEGSNKALIEASNRVIALQQQIGEMQLRTDFVNTYMSESENGLVIGMKDGTSSVRVSNDRISFYSGGKETAFITQGFLQIEAGVFTLRLRIGHYLFEEDSSGMLLIRKIR